MKYKVCTFDYLTETIKNSEVSLVLFGAGAIGYVVTPELLRQQHLFDKVDCYIDNDSTKWNTTITVKDKQLDVKSPEYLKQCNKDTIIIINISRYAQVIEQLEQMECTKEMTVVIMPMLLIENYCSAVSKGTPTITNDPLIPKKIHYIWFGGSEIPYNLRKCIETWGEKCPDYEIVRWDENNYDFSKHPYMKQAYECGKYGFVSDYARLDILYNQGGFYFDTDVEIKKNIDFLRYQEAFCGVEKWQILNTGGGCGAIKGHPMIKKFLEARENILFLDENGRQNRNTCGFYDTQTALEAGYQINGATQNVQGMNIYAYDFFHPYDYMSGITNETSNTVSIHRFNGGWMDENMKEQNRLAKLKYDEVYKRCM